MALSGPKYALAWLKCLHPQKPLYADSPLGCGAFNTRFA